MQILKARAAAGFSQAANWAWIQLKNLYETDLLPNFQN